MWLKAALSNGLSAGGEKECLWPNERRMKPMKDVFRIIAPLLAAIMVALVPPPPGLAQNA
jgi:hypothetical protein